MSIIIGIIISLIITIVIMIIVIMHDHLGRFQTGSHWSKSSELQIQHAAQ